MTMLDLPDVLRFHVDKMHRNALNEPGYLLRSKDGCHTGTGIHLVVAHMYGFDDNFEFEVEFRPGMAPSTFRRVKWLPAQKLAFTESGRPDLTLPVDDDMIRWKQTNLYATAQVLPMDPGMDEFFAARDLAPNRFYRYTIMLLRYERSTDA